jgi:hypothetical protein
VIELKDGAPGGFSSVTGHLAHATNSTPKSVVRSNSVRILNFIFHAPLRIIIRERTELADIT